MEPASQMDSTIAAALFSRICKNPILLATWQRGKTGADAFSQEFSGRGAERGLRHSHKEGGTSPRMSYQRTLQTLSTNAWSLERESRGSFEIPWAM
jgi:hypothetical protein